MQGQIARGSIRLAFGAACLVLASNAQANAQLAPGKGCYSCRGHPRKKHADERLTQECALALDHRIIAGSRQLDPRQDQGPGTSLCDTSKPSAT